jgi:kynurenine formamidase
VGLGRRAAGASAAGQGERAARHLLGRFWAAHFVGVEREYCQIEQLTNLDKLPPFGFRVCAFPLKVAGGSAGPARVVALVEDKDEEEALKDVDGPVTGGPSADR